MTLLTQKEAAQMLKVSTSWLRASSCPKRLLPGNGPTGKPLVRYHPQEIEAWSKQRDRKQEKVA